MCSKRFNLKAGDEIGADNLQFLGVVLSKQVTLLHKTAISHGAIHLYPTMMLSAVQWSLLQELSFVWSGYRTGPFFVGRSLLR